MPSTDKVLETYRTDMRNLAPGDVLRGLHGVPEGMQIVVLARIEDGNLIFSKPALGPHLVEHPQGPFRWADEHDTILAFDGSVFEAIDLNTTVTKQGAINHARLYHNVRVFLHELVLPSPALIGQLVGADAEKRLALEAIINNPWDPSLEVRLTAAYAYTSGRKVSPETLAFLIVSANAALRFAQDLVRRENSSGPHFGIEETTKPFG